MVRNFAWGLAAVLSLSLVFAAQARAQDDGDKKFTDKLTDNDPLDKKLVKSPHKVHAYKMKEGTVYVIEMQSKDFDSFLRLELDGKEVAFDDDGGGFPNARIAYKAAKGGEYKIIATSFDGKGGEYVVTVRKGTEDDLNVKKGPKAPDFKELVGKAAPEISSEFTLNGQAKKLSDLKGKVVLVDFWAVWCGPCIATFPHLREWSKEFKQDGFEVVGVTTYFERFGFDKEGGKLKQVGKVVKDENTGKTKLEGGLKAAEEHDMIKDFAGHHKLTHQLMTVTKDAWTNLAKDYQVTGIPHAVLLDRQGNIRMVRVGSGPQNAADLEAEIRKLLKEKN